MKSNEFNIKSDVCDKVKEIIADYYSDGIADAAVNKYEQSLDMVVEDILGYLENCDTS